MDEVDVRLVQLLMMNSRVPYRVLADQMDISLQAVHTRVQSMFKARVIQGFTASLSPSYLGAIGVDVIGRSDPPPSEETVNAIGARRSATDIFLSAGGYVLVRGLLRSHQELEPFLQSMKDKGRITDIWVGFQSFGLAGRRRMEDAESGDMTPLDFRILSCLRADARMPTNEIAEEVGVSTKTVARRLERMVRDRRINLTVKWYPGMAPGVVTYLQVRLKNGVDKMPSAVALSEKYSPRIVFLGSYSNFPDLLGAIAWTPTPVAQNALTSELAREQTVSAVVTYVLLRKYEFQTWVDELIVSKAGAKKARAD